MDTLKSLVNCKVFSTVLQEEDEKGWLAARSRGIGGSDIGAICGINPWTTARHIYFKKTGQFQEGIEDFSESAKERMHFGHMLEPIVADEYQRRTGRKVVVSPATLQHKDYPWALANVDRLIVDGYGNPYGVLECKTASDYLATSWEEGDVPIYYLYQLNWYLWITGLKFGAIAAIVGGNKFYYYEITRNDDLIRDELLPKAEHFWNHNVKELIMPEIDGSEASKELLDAMNPIEDIDKKSEIVLENDVCNELAKTIVDGKAKIKELEKTVAEATNRLKEYMGLNVTGYTTDHVIKWAPRKQIRIDSTRIKNERPDLFAKYNKVIEYREFRVK